MSANRPDNAGGRHALVEFARAQVARRTNSLGAVEDGEWLCGQILDAFAAMVGAEPGALWPDSPATSDPVFTIIAEGRRLLARHDRLNAVVRAEHDDHRDGMRRRRRTPHSGALARSGLEHRPADLAGCRALAGYATDFQKYQEIEISEGMTAVLDLIARSPLAMSAEHDGINPAKLAAEQVDLKALDVQQLAHLHEAYQAARYAWEGVRGRPSASRTRMASGSST